MRGSEANFAHLSDTVDKFQFDQEVVMMILVVVLLVLWLITAVIGFAFEGLIWLAIVGIVLFVGTVVIGLVRRRALRR